MGTILKRGNGYQAIIRKSGHKPIYRTFAKKAQAKNWIVEKEAQINEGLYKDSRSASKRLLSTLFSRYLADITPTKRASSYVPERARNRTLVASLGHLTLAAFSVEHVLDFVDQRQKQGVSADSIRKELQLLSDVMDTARVVWNIPIPHNPVPEARQVMRKLRKLGAGNRRDRRLTDEEYQKLTTYRHRQPTFINQIVAFAIETGMRRGEIANMKRSHIHGNTLKIPIAKTRARTIPLSAKAIQILDSLPTRIDGSVWGMEAGSMTRAFVRLCRLTGIAGLRFHDLRHEAASRFFEKGLSIEEVAAITGHDDWRSLKRYTHPDAERLALRL